MLEQVYALNYSWILDMVQESCSVHDIGHWGMETLFGGSFKLCLKTALCSLLLALPHIFSPLFVLAILCSSRIALGVILVTSISSKIVC